MKEFPSEKTTDILLDHTLEKMIEKFSNAYKIRMFELSQNLKNYSSTELRHKTDIQEEYTQFVLLEIILQKHTNMNNIYYNKLMNAEQIKILMSFKLMSILNQLYWTVISRQNFFKETVKKVNKKH